MRRSVKKIKISLNFCILLLVWLSSICAQSQISEQQRPNDEELASNKRTGDVLRHPTLISLRLVSSPLDAATQPTDTPSPFTVNDFIEFRLMIRHSFFEPLEIYSQIDPYYDVRPELFRDGDLLSYTEEAKKNVERTENTPPEGSGGVSRIMPGREYNWLHVRLDHWYKPLEPGHYQLIVRERFAWEGEWLQSSSITFDVLAEKPGGDQKTRSEKLDRQ
jgi:hypothetical protein